MEANRYAAPNARAATSLIAPWGADHHDEELHRALDLVSTVGRSHRRLAWVARIERQAQSSNRMATNLSESREKFGSSLFEPRFGTCINLCVAAAVLCPSDPIAYADNMITIRQCYIIIFTVRADTHLILKLGTTELVFAPRIPSTLHKMTKGRVAPAAPRGRDHRAHAMSSLPP
jgi:hypothetical protein